MATDQDILSIPSAAEISALAALGAARAAEAASSISEAEIREIDQQIEAQREAERPVIEATPDQRDAFLAARENIMQRYGWSLGELPPEYDPIIIVQQPHAPLTHPELPPPEPPPEPEPEVLPPISITSLPTGPDPGEAPWSVESDTHSDQPGGESVDLSGLFGAIGQIGSAYVQTRYAPTPRAVAAPAPGGYEGSLRDWIDGPFDALAPATPVGPVRTVSGHCKPRRRRRRMLTKSDIADISTMASILGKNSEAFKTWLAKATR